MILIWIMPHVYDHDRSSYNYQKRRLRERERERERERNRGWGWTEENRGKGGWVLSHTIATFGNPSNSCINLERVAVWLRRWTQDKGVWVSIPAVLVICKKTVNLWIHTAPVHPALMGTRWNENLYCVNGYSCRKLRCVVPREMRLWTREFQYLGVINVILWIYTGISGLLNTLFYLYFPL